MQLKSFLDRIPPVPPAIPNVPPPGTLAAGSFFARLPSIFAPLPLFCLSPLPFLYTSLYVYLLSSSANGCRHDSVLPVPAERLAGSLCRFPNQHTGPLELPHHVVLHIAVFLYIHATNNLTGCSLNGRFTFPLSGCLLALALALVSWLNPAGCSYFWLPTRAHPSPSWRVQAPDQMVAAE